MKPSSQPFLISDNVFKNLQRDIKLRHSNSIENVWVLTKIKIYKEPYILINDCVRKIKNNNVKT